MIRRTLPWFTDGSIRFLEGFIHNATVRNKARPRVLEFGMGAGTLYWAPRAGEVISFEHDARWHASIQAAVTGLGFANCKLILGTRPYWKEVEAAIAGRQFDIIAIDGRDRVGCLEEVMRLGALAKGGVLVLDNTERISGQDKRYAPMVDMLAPRFESIHFEQAGTDVTGWTADHRWLTTIAFERGAPTYTTLGNTL